MIHIDREIPQENKESEVKLDVVSAYRYAKTILDIAGKEEPPINGQHALNSAKNRLQNLMGIKSITFDTTEYPEFKDLLKKAIPETVQPEVSILGKRNKNGNYNGIEIKVTDQTARYMRRMPVLFMSLHITKEDLDQSTVREFEDSIPIPFVPAINGEKFGLIARQTVTFLGDASALLRQERATTENIVYSSNTPRNGNE